MPLSHRFFWGLLAGLVIVMVKILGPDQTYVRSLFLESDLASVSFYGFISLLTVGLGAISGLFTDEQKPAKLLVFCASVPALLSTFTAEKREAIPEPRQASIAEPTVGEIELPGALRGFSILSGSIVPAAHAATARAQTADGAEVCQEGGFAQKFTQSARQYLSGTKSSNQPYFAVVVKSTKNLDEAKRAADEIWRKDKAFRPYVGCRRPGNAYFPVVIGPDTTKEDAAVWLGRFKEAQIMRDEPYVSYYEYRSPIYTPG